ncbi:MAG: winged helix-turn-helix transcriptional regulator [Gammaproteobacteria bacterium]|nr:winged helix-turn-helix transcriptional regulator [Gammaproteobacteria bacterium]
MKRKRYHLPHLESVRAQRHVCFAEQLRSASRAITRLYNEHLGSTDIGVAQLSLLVRLYFVEDVEMSRLARLLETDRTTLARNVQLLVRSGHLEVVGSEDRRKRHVRLTDQGFESLKTAIPRWLAAQRELRQRLGDDTWDTLFEGLRQLAELENSASAGRRKPATARAIRDDGPPASRASRDRAANTLEKSVTTRSRSARSAKSKRPAH